MIAPLVKITEMINELNLVAEFNENISLNRCVLQISITHHNTDLTVFPEVVALVKVTSSLNQTVGFNAQLPRKHICSHEFENSDPFEPLINALTAINKLNVKTGEFSEVFEDYFTASREIVSSRATKARDELRETMEEISSERHASQILDQLIESATTVNLRREKESTIQVYIVGESGNENKVNVRVEIKKHKLFFMGGVKTSRTEVIERITNNFIVKSAA